MNEEEKNDTLIIVFVAEVSEFLEEFFRGKELDSLGTAKRGSYKRTSFVILCSASVIERGGSTVLFREIL